MRKQGTRPSGPRTTYQEEKRRSKVFVRRVLAHHGLRLVIIGLFVVVPLVTPERVSEVLVAVLAVYSDKIIALASIFE